jgi:hypothetical protein
MPVFLRLAFFFLSADKMTQLGSSLPLGESYKTTGMAQFDSKKPYSIKKVLKTGLVKQNY